MATWSTKYASSAALNLVVTATESEVNIANNTSKVTVVVQLKSSANQTAWNGYSQSLSVSVDGVSVGSRTFTYSVPAGGTVTLGTYSRVVPHNSDGTKTARIQVSASGGGDSGSIDNNLGLTTIARASEVTVTPSTVNFGESVRIKVHKKSSGFTSTIKLAWSTTNLTLWDKISWTEGDWTVPTTLAPPNATTGWGRIIVETYNGTTLVGTKETRINGVVPNTAAWNPSATAPTFAEKNNKISSGITGVWVLGQSQVEYKATFATRGGATASSAEFQVVHNGVTYRHPATISGTTATATDVPGGSGTHSVRLVVTDSRGRSATSAASTYSVTAYTAPKLSVAKADRNAASPTTILISATASGSNLSNKNTMTLKIYVKNRTDTSWGTAKHTLTSTTGGITLTNYALAGYAETGSFDVRFELYDELSAAVYSQTTISTTRVPLDVYKDIGVGIGKMYDPAVGGSLQIGGKVWLEDFQHLNDVPWTTVTTLQNGYTGEVRYRKVGRSVTVIVAAVKAGDSSRLGGALQIFQLPTNIAPPVSIWDYGMPSPAYTIYPEQHGAAGSLTANTGQIHIQRSSHQGTQYIFNFSYEI